MSEGKRGKRKGGEKEKRREKESVTR